MASEGRGRLSSIDTLPEEAQEDIAWAMGELNRRQRTQAEILSDLNGRLADKNLPLISRSAFNRRSMRVANAARRIAEGRALFEGIAPQFTPERVDESNIVIGELIKMLIAELLDDGAEALTPKNSMEMARAYLATIQGQKLSAERRTKLVEQFKKEAGEQIAKVGKA
ncbi:phage protein Gp27 family protein, partial [Methylosinus sp. Sm6]|uniref:phage protein Gp27 family protein n=1 Tax=Methylosinus sp. Sm6 TaxID=2866948 RepID=UPI001C99FE7E